MPKKKTIPPPDDFSSEFMETEFVKELSEQQAEAADSDRITLPKVEEQTTDIFTQEELGVMLDKLEAERRRQ